MADAMGAAGGGVIRIDAFRNQALESDASKGHFRVDDQGALRIKSVKISNRGQHDEKADAKAAFENALHDFFRGDQAKIDAVKHAVDPGFDDNNVVDLKKVRSFFATGAGATNAKLTQFAEDAVRIRETLTEHDVDSDAIDKILAGKNSASLTIWMDLKPRDYMQYVQLQQSISRFIGPENQRPTIDLTLKGDGPNAPQTSSLGIVGGTGPLSDAAMLEKTMKKLLDAGADPDSLHLRLHSAPPPRGKVQAASPMGARYAGRLRGFCTQPDQNGQAQPRHQAIVLASNTAHGNMGIMKLTVHSACHDRIRDLVDNVVDFVVADTPEGREESLPLILGTDAAYKDNLYPDRFGNVDSLVVQEGSDDNDLTLNKEQLLEVGALDHKKLQGFINYAKQNGFDADLAERLEQLIRSQITSQEPRATHVILGCTELPLALGEERIHAMNHDQNLGVKIIDTEEFFADRYAELIAEQLPGNVGERLRAQ